METNENGEKALHLATHSGWYRFEHRGEEWTQTDRALTYWQMCCIEVDPQNPKHLYIGTARSGIFVTEDGGKDWTRAGRAHSAIFSSTDGAQWRHLTDQVSGGVMNLCPSLNGGVFVATADGEVIKISESGESKILISGLPCITAMALGA